MFITTIISPSYTSLHGIHHTRAAVADPGHISGLQKGLIKSLGPSRGEEEDEVEEEEEEEEEEEGCRWTCWGSVLERGRRRGRS